MPGVILLPVVILMPGIILMPTVSAVGHVKILCLRSSISPGRSLLQSVLVWHDWSAAETMALGPDSSLELPYVRGNATAFVSEQAL